MTVRHRSKPMRDPSRIRVLKSSQCQRCKVVYMLDGVPVEDTVRTGDTVVLWKERHDPNAKSYTVVSIYQVGVRRKAISNAPEERIRFCQIRHGVDTLDVAATAIVKPSTIRKD